MPESCELHPGKTALALFNVGGCNVDIDYPLAMRASLMK